MPITNEHKDIPVQNVEQPAPVHTEQPRVENVKQETSHIDPVVNNEVKVENQSNIDVKQQINDVRKEDVVNTPETPIKTPHVENNNVGDTNTTIHINNEQKAFTGPQNDVKEVTVDKNIETPKATENIINEQPKVDISKNTNNNIEQPTASHGANETENIPNTRINENENEVPPADVRSQNNINSPKADNVLTSEHKPGSDVEHDVGGSDQSKPVKPIANNENVVAEQPNVNNSGQTVNPPSVEQNSGAQPAPSTTSKENVGHGEPSTITTEVDAKNIPNEVRTETSIPTGSVQANRQQQTMSDGEINVSDNAFSVLIINHIFIEKRLKLGTLLLGNEKLKLVPFEYGFILHINPSFN
jgi:hypothetical protein